MAQADTAKMNLYQKILKIMGEVGTIEKTGKNQLQHYEFIEQGMIVAELRPQLEKWGVVILPETVSRTIERYDVTRGTGKQGVDVHVSVKSRYTVVNADNPEERFTAEWDAGEAIDSGDKASNKAVTASNKTYLMKLFNISDKEDADAYSPSAPPAKYMSTPPPTVKLATDVQKAQIKSFARALGIADEDLARELHDTYGVKNPQHITADEAKAAIEAMK